MDQKRKIWAITGVLRSGEETPRSGEGPCSSEGSPRNNEVEREGWPGLGFAASKLTSLQRSSASPRRSHYSQHGNVVLLFRFVFPLFRRLVY